MPEWICGRTCIIIFFKFMFLGPVFLFPERVGIHGLSDADLEVLAYHHFVVGRSQGIRDDVNLYGGNLEEIRAHCWDVHMKAREKKT